MSRKQFFLITTAVIFVTERFLPLLTHWPLFIFPVFAIMFALTAPNDAKNFKEILIASLIFDPFSGYRFGFFTIAIILLMSLIIVFKTRFNIDYRSFFLLGISTIIFTFAYFVIVSIKSDPKLLFFRAAFMLMETAIVFLVLNFPLRCIKH